MQLKRAQNREELLVKVTMGIACVTLFLLLYVLTIREM